MAIENRDTSKKTIAKVQEPKSQNYNPNPQNIIFKIDIFGVTLPLTASQLFIQHAGYFMDKVNNMSYDDFQTVLYYQIVWG